MRLMLGTKNSPRLLVEVVKETDEGFHFYVVNGRWNGEFHYTDVDKGTVFVGMSGVDDEVYQYDSVDILSNNQSRLQGDYQDVFYNWYNPNYVAPSPERAKLPDDWEDDIAF